MRGEIITIGNELTSGRTIDVNSCYAAEMLTAAGLEVLSITSVGDNHEMVSVTLREAMQRSEFIIVTGGLGSTDDDITNEIVAEVLESPLVLDNETLKHIRNRADEMGLKLTDSLKKMAWMPEGSRLLDHVGRACGFSLKKEGVYLYFLPGVPEQMRYLLNKFVIPALKKEAYDLPAVRHKVLKLYGLNEPELAEKLKYLRGRTGKAVLGFYPNFPENHITITLSGGDEVWLEKEILKVETEIKRLVGPYIFAAGDDTMEEALGKMLVEKGLTISVAESCTGGLIGHRLTSVPGSSRYFQGGLVVYSNEAKVALLNVSPDTLKKYGAVSEQTAKEMARGVREAVSADLSVSVTGIAGPDGGSSAKPVGTVHIGLAAKDTLVSRQYRFWGNRQQVKLNTSTMALDWIRRYMNGDSFLPGV